MKSKLARAVLFLAGCWLAVPAGAQSEEVDFGHLAMQWPSGYTVVRPAEPVLLRGPQAQEVAASVYVATEDTPQAQRSFADRSERLVRSAAASHGRVVRFTRSVLPDGSLLVAAASQARGAAGGYLLQFTVLSPAGHVGYVTVEGQGRHAAGEFRRLLPLFHTVRWLAHARAADRT